MRKFIAIFLCVVLLCGCSAGGSSTAETAAGPESITITRQFTIVAPKGSDVAVTEAANCIQAVLNYKLKVSKVKVVDTDPGSDAIVFQVDENMDPGAYKAELKGTSIYLTAQDPHILLLITRQLRQLMLDNGSSPVVTKEMCAELTGTMDISTLPFRVLSQNILFKNIEGGNTVTERLPRFAALVHEYCPDVMPIQEHSGGWETFIPKEFGDIYTRHATQGLAIYFRTSRYEILDKGGFYMSPTPNEKSQFEGDSGPRSCIWAIAKDKLTDTEILFINCHPDWNNDTQRALQVNVIFEYLSEKMKEYPTILCGDFNTEPTGSVYPRIVQEFKDAYAEAERNLSEIDYTCHSFGENATFIDYTFYSDAFKPIEYKIIHDMFLGHVSDHYGTYTDFVLNK